MLAVSPGFLAALAAPHQVTLRADVSKAGVRLYSGLPVTAGSIEVDSSSITRRRLSCQLTPRLPVGTYGDAPTLPTSPGDPLGHYGQEITVSWGLTYTGGVTEWLPGGGFRVEGASGSLLSDGPVQVSGVSREAFVADARFTAPYTASSGSAQSLIGTLIHEVLPTVEVVVTGDHGPPGAAHHLGMRTVGVRSPTWPPRSPRWCTQTRGAGSSSPTPPRRPHPRCGGSPPVPVVSW